MRAKEEALFLCAFPKSLSTLLDRVGVPGSLDADRMALYLEGRLHKGEHLNAPMVTGSMEQTVQPAAGCYCLHPFAAPQAAWVCPPAPGLGMGPVRRTLEETISLLEC